MGYVLRGRRWYRSGRNSDLPSELERTVERNDSIVHSPAKGREEREERERGERERRERGEREERED